MPYPGISTVETARSNISTVETGIPYSGISTVETARSNVSTVETGMPYPGISTVETQSAMVLRKAINMKLVQMSTEACGELALKSYNVLRETF